MADQDFLVKLTRERYADKIRNRARTLRALADEVDRIADRVLTVDTPDFTGPAYANNLAWMAHTVQHEIINAVPNLGLAQLTSAAWDYETLKRGNS